MAWYITDGVLQRADFAPAENSILTDITGEGDVVIPEGVTEIDEYTFSECEKLTSVIFSDSMLGIGWRAFFSCSALKSIRIPVGTVRVDDAAFEVCQQLQDIILHIPLSVNDSSEVSHRIAIQKGRFTDIDIALNHPLFRLEDKLLISSDGVLLWAHSDVENAVIYKGVTEIGSCAFQTCKKLVSVKLPEGLTTMGDKAFYRCSELRRIRIPKSVTSIGREAFKMCINIEQIDLPHGLKSIGDGAFVGCRRLFGVTVPDSVTNIGGKTFTANGIKHITIPAVLWEQMDNYALQRQAVICCPISLKRVSDDEMKCKLCIGFARNQYKYSQRLRKEYIEWIRENSVKLVGAAFDYPELFRLMCGKRLIGDADVDEFLEESLRRENVELTAMVLNYKAALKTVAESNEWDL